MKVKKKKCSNCGEMRPLWKSRPPLCSYCANTTRKPIKKISDKHKKTLSEYKKIREAFLLENPVCQLRLQDCTYNATEIEHRQGKDTKELWLDTTKWFAVCRSCHNLVENALNREALDKGLKLKRNT